jgi:intein-encoded DNA endonuclease-like protein
MTVTISVICNLNYVYASKKTQEYFLSWESYETYTVWTERRDVSVRVGGTYSNHCVKKACDSAGNLFLDAGVVWIQTVQVRD